MTKTSLERIRTLLNISDNAQDTLLEALLLQAREAILTYCNRPEMTPGLVNAQVQLAVIYYNRQGMEGEQSHGEGGVSRTIFVMGNDIPDSILSQLNAHRWLRAVTRG